VLLACGVRMQATCQLRPERARSYSLLVSADAVSATTQEARHLEVIGIEFLRLIGLRRRHGGRGAHGHRRALALRRDGLPIERLVELAQRTRLVEARRDDADLDVGAHP